MSTPKFIQNYRHAFQAGSWVDIVKHAVFAHALEGMLVAKPGKPLLVLDTHAAQFEYLRQSGVPDARATGADPFIRAWRREQRDSPKSPEWDLLNPLAQRIDAAYRAGVCGWL
jgi:23S rRNA A2030 N6-methylase RlmJ